MYKGNLGGTVMHLHVKSLGKNMDRVSPLISCNSETPSIHSKGEMMRARGRGRGQPRPPAKLARRDKKDG